MAVYVTGDIHGEPSRLSKDNFYEQKDFSDNKDENIKYDVSSFEELIANARNKAIDDFATKICEILEEYQTGFNMVSMANIWHFSKELAEQLKAGVENES